MKGPQTCEVNLALTIDNVLVFRNTIYLGLNT